MRRTVLSIVAVVFGTALLVGLKSPSVAARMGTVADAPLDPAAAPPASTATGAPAPGQPAPARTPTVSAHPGSTPKPGQTTTAPAGGGATTTGTTPPGGGGPTTTTAPPTSSTYTGAAIAVRSASSPTAPRGGCGSCETYTIAVTITVSGGRITAATAVLSPTPGGESGQDANNAKKGLLPKVLSSQTWNVGHVSSATYASNALELSAKDAMSKAGLPV